MIDRVSLNVGSIPGINSGISSGSGPGSVPGSGSGLDTGGMLGGLCNVRTSSLLFLLYYFYMMNYGIMFYSL